MIRLKQLWVSTRFALLSFRRNPAATFFTVILPVIFMVLFGTIFGDEVTDTGATVATFTVPGILALSVISATFVNLAITSVFRREKGQLKRLRGTPLPPAIYIAAQVLSSAAIVAVMTVLLISVGRAMFDVTFNMNTLGVFVLSLLLGTAVFSALGLAVTAIIPNEDAAPAVTNIIALPLYFVSDVFIDTTDAPKFITWVGNVFPVKHLALTFQDSFNPFVTEVDVPWGHWGVMALWGAFGAFVAVTRFRWAPK